MEKMSAKEFWKRLDAIMKSRSINYVDLAQMCRINRVTLYNNRSRDKYPNIKVMVSIAMALDVSLDWLVLGENKQSKLDEMEFQSVYNYLNAPKAVKDIVDRILRGDE